MTKFTLRAYDVVTTFTDQHGNPINREAYTCGILTDEPVQRHETRELIFNETHSRRVVLNDRYDRTVRASLISGALVRKGEIKLEWEEVK